MSKLPLYGHGALEGRLCIIVYSKRLKNLPLLGQEELWCLVILHQRYCELSPAQRLKQSSSYAHFRTLLFRTQSQPQRITWKVAKYLLSGVSTTTQYWEKSSLRRNFVQFLFTSHGIGFLHTLGPSAVALSASLVQSHFKKKKYEITYLPKNPNVADSNVSNCLFYLLHSSFLEANELLY